MRILPVAAVAVCGVMAAVAAWQVIESTDDLKDIGDYLPTSTPEQNVIEIAVDEGMSPQDIGERLEDAAVIDSATQFNVLVALLGYEGMLQAETMSFSRAHRRLPPFTAYAARPRRGL
jgi:cell division protein YceG involved in septum cleavage